LVPAGKVQNYDSKFYFESLGQLRAGNHTAEHPLSDEESVAVTKLYYTFPFV